MRDLDCLDLATVDPGNMRTRISELPEQCLQAWELVEALKLPEAYKQASRVVIAGMGGSAIGGDLVRTLAVPVAPVPVVVSREYTVPACVDQSTLFIASSYSGNTEETLAALDEAIARGAKCVGVGTGGLLERRAHDSGIPFVQFSYQSAPRAALGYSLICLLGILHAANVIPDMEQDLIEAVEVMRAWQSEIHPEVPSDSNAAKKLAMRIHRRLPVVYGAGTLSQVARRWKGQFNENSKAWSFFEIMPELNHNAVLGYDNPPDFSERCIVIMLRSPEDHPRVQIRFDVTAELLDQRSVPHEMVWARGRSSLAHMLSVVHFGDYVSLYLAYLYETDPTPVDAIDYLKHRLAKA